MVPVVYQAVLSTVPGVHNRPAALPPSEDSHLPPKGGYDFVLHVGVAGPGPLRIEKLARKTGYYSPDVEGCYAPVVTESTGVPLRSTVMSIVDGLLRRPIHGFSEGYEDFPEVLHTKLDTLELVKHLKASGVDKVTESVNAGLYLCEFITYCSLAEALRTAGHRKGTEQVEDGAKYTPTLFMHCPPVGQPLTTEEVTDGIKKIVQWVCRQLDA